MIKIAFCDDDSTVLSDLHELLALYRAITMSCLAEIPISRGKYNEIKNAFLEYAFFNKQMTT